MLRSHYQHYPRGVAFHRQRYKYVGALASGVLLLLGYLLLCPPTLGQGANALDNTSTNTSTRLSIKAVETVSVRMASQVGVDIRPISSGAFGIAQTELGVTTNDPEGFEIFLSTADKEAALRGADAKIDTITAQTVGSAFTGNTWGYSIDKSALSEASTYSPMSATSTSILKTNVATVNQEDIYQLGFGVHITPNLPAGEYSTSVILSVVANPATINDLSDLVYMQDMTGEICSNTPSAYNASTGAIDRNSAYYLTPITKQLYDLRDGKQYWVAKLADGNCWMTQNLALDLDVNSDSNAVAVSEKGNKIELNSTNTDVSSSNVTGILKTETSVPTKGSMENNVKVARSWNLGNYVYTTPTSGSLCPQANATESWTPSDQHDSLSPGQTLANLNKCAGKYKEYAAGDDTHYLVGNYYTWSAVTAKTGDDLAGNADGSDVATGSICPKGWRLPTSGLNTADQQLNANGEFYKLLHAYGYPASTGTATSIQAGKWFWNNNYLYTPIVQAEATRIETAPIYLTRSGLLLIRNGSLYNAGRNDDLWSSSVYSSFSAFSLNFNDTVVNPANLDPRAFGFSARCLAR